MKAIITLAIGESFHSLGSISHPTFRKYAKKINADFKVITVRSTTSKIIHFEKLQLGELLKAYDRIIYLDTDIIIRDDCPDLFQLVPQTKLGIYDESLLATEEQKQIHRSVMGKAFKLYNQPFVEGGFYNTGVMVLSKHHSELFERPEQDVLIEYMEQPYLNIRIRQLKLDIHDIGYKFNRMQYVSQVVKQHRLASYIVHYAGIPGCASIMRRDINTIYEEIK